MVSSSLGERGRKFERLIALSRSLNQFEDLDAYLQMAINTASDLTNSEASSIILFEEETGLLKFVAAPLNQREALRRIRVPVERSIAGLAYEHAAPVVIQDARLDPRLYRAVDRDLGFETRSIVAVPISLRGKPIGAFETVNKLDDALFTQDDVTILEIIASYAATAIFVRLLMDEIESAYESLDELDRMKSNFIAIASHELRTPLGLILGHATFMRDSAAEISQKKQLDVIVNSALKLKGLIDEMSSAEAERQAPSRVKRTPIHMGELIQRVCDGFQDEARKARISLTTSIPKVDLVVDGDAEKLATALGNIVKNAIIYSNDNGHVLVTAEKLPGYVKVSVIDNGIGIPAKDLQRVFDKFFQVESHFTRRHGGMGLGLSVAKVMIELHGGEIWVESVEGKGSNFSFLLPSKTKETDPERRVFEV
jgi:signal transduction histidine kinase